MGDTGERLRNSSFFIVVISSGAGMFARGLGGAYWDGFTTVFELLTAIGIAFIIAGAVGMYMMWTTEKVARGLHQRFDEQIAILKEIVASQKEMASSQKELVASQKEMASSQKEIVASQKELVASQKEMASSQKETSSKMISILERIDSKLGGNPNLAADKRA